MIAPHDYKINTKRCDIRINDQVYDCTHWRAKHPGGAQLLDHFHNGDATDAFYALHSKDAEEMLKRLKHVPAKQPSGKDIIPRDTVAASFELWRQRLVKDGWFQRRWELDLLLVILPCTFLTLAGTWLSFQDFAFSQLLATILLGVAMQQAGWMGHDYCHGRGTTSWIVGNTFACLINGFSPSWWSNKHNTHHCFPNRKEYDPDIHMEPILHLWFPSAEKDKWFRRHQHKYYLFAYSLLYVSWRMQSLQFILGSKNWLERVLICLGYAWLACLPLPVAVGSIFLGGFLVAVIVTANHQSEDMLEPDDHYNFCADQFTTTRGVHCSNWFAEYLFGGMQYQLEHHMFPTMPKYYYPALRPHMAAFAKQHSLPFKVSGVREILKLNYDVMKKHAAELD